MKRYEKDETWRMYKDFEKLSNDINQLKAKRRIHEINSSNK